MAGRRGRRSTRAGSPAASSSSACAAPTRTAASTPRRRSTPAPGAWSSIRGTPPSLGARRCGGRVGADRARPARGDAEPGDRLAPRARLPRGGDHRVDGQDLGQGHRPRDPAAARPRQPRELQHRDRPAADDPRRAARDRGPGARDGDARARPDRRALRDRRARRRRRSPTSARFISSCSGRSRRSPRRRRRSSTGSARAGPRWSRPTPRRSSRTSTSAWRRSPSAPAATSSRTARAASAPGSRPRSSTPERRGGGWRCRSPRPTTSPTRPAPSRSASRSARIPRRWRVGRPDISFSRLRGELIDLPGGSVLVNDCYNANPVSMRAALDHLASLDAPGRRIAVLGGMAELGPQAAAVPP